jgi:hypothetical protein
MRCARLLRGSIAAACKGASPLDSPVRLCQPPKLQLTCEVVMVGPLGVSHLEGRPFPHAPANCQAFQGCDW